jgi:hypothetical protein
VKIVFTAAATKPCLFLDIGFEDPRKLKLPLQSIEPILCAKHLINILKCVLLFAFFARKIKAQRG